ncbi:GNAT family N-acetyltransferase [Candidatus Poribacteria bacterium]|nr:GNAT family N-acetyltransferase [Candidatus Poribacteria bacterium]
MYERIGEASLKNGASMETGVVLCPDAEHADEIRPFLGHKGQPWQHHIEGAVAGPLDDLETRFYVGKVDGRIITNIMTVEHVGVGILGHVYTTPERRRLGACNAVMEAQMEEFRTRGARCLYLGTGFDSAAYHIYKRNGFGSVLPRSGFMSYFTEDGFEAAYFAARPCTAREVRWDDWGPVTALTGSHDGDWLRSVAWRMQGPESFEGDFLGLRQRIADGDVDAHVLVTDDGARVGVATLGRHPMWGDARLLDVLCHPNYWPDARKLVDALATDARTLTYVDSAAHAKLDALTALGFLAEVTLPARARRRLRPDWRPSDADADMFDDSAFEDTPLDVTVLAR